MGCSPAVFRVTIPGPPKAQGRGKAARWSAKDGRSGVAVRDPSSTRDWKRRAEGFFARAIQDQGLLPPVFAGDVPLKCEVLFLFPLPKSQERKRSPVPRRPHTGKTADIDNLQKALLDAGNALLWEDDCQVACVVAEKVVGAQGESPRVEIAVTPLRAGQEDSE